MRSRPSLITCIRKMSTGIANPQVPKTRKTQGNTSKASSMAIFLTGDTHGRIIPRLGLKNFPEQRDLDPAADNYVIVLGDLGLIWDLEPSKNERYILNWLDEKPFKLLFVDGNHENHARLDAMPVTELLGGRVHQLSDNVFHLMRGEMFDINGYSFFAFGGAASHDISTLLDPVNDPNWKRKRRKLKREDACYRVIGRNWWDREQAGESERAHGFETLDAHGWKCDFVLTHTPPASVLREIDDELEPDKTALYFDELRERLDFKHWFSGHLHKEKNIGDRDHVLYHQIFLLSNK